MYIFKLVVSPRYTPFGNYTLRTYRFPRIDFLQGKKEKITRIASKSIVMRN